MSNYHYNDQSGCGSCSLKSGYRTLGQTCATNKLPDCMDRENSERSVKDKMYYDFYVLNKPWHLKPDTQLVKEWESHTYAENNTL